MSSPQIDFRNASQEACTTRLAELSTPINVTITQDALDKIKIANTYLMFERCNKCLRLTNYGYCCPHCGHDGS